MAVISETIFSCDFFWMKFSLIKISLKFGYLHRRQAIISTNADPIHCRIYAALGGDELNKFDDQ